MATAKVFFLTHHPFWLANTGTRNRVAALWQSLHSDPRFDVKICYQRFLNAADRAAIANLGIGSNITDLPRVQTKSSSFRMPEIAEKFPLFKNHVHRNVAEAFSHLVNEQKPQVIFSTYIADYPYIPPNSNAIRILDTNDIVSLRSMVFRAWKRPAPFGIDVASEINILNTFDYVIGIQDREYLFLRAATGPEKAVYLPMTAGLAEPLPLPSSPRLQMLFPASHQAPNVDGLRWFLSEVWPYFSGKEIDLIVSGTILEALGAEGKAIEARFGNVKFVGIAPNLKELYAGSHIVLNPVLYGSGIKVKTVEALKYGRCLLTTPAGAEGLQPGIDKAFLVAHSAQSLIENIEEIIRAPEIIEYFSGQATLFYNAFCQNGFFYKNLQDMIYTSIVNRGL